MGGGDAAWIRHCPQLLLYHGKNIPKIFNKEFAPRLVWCRQYLADVLRFGGVLGLSLVDCGFGRAS
jgi:hypothetical protein